MRYISEYVKHERYNGTVTDPRGNQVESWASAVDLGIYAFNPGGTSEPFTPGHDRVVTKPTIYVPSGAVVRAHDKITVRGKPYTVDGDTLDFRNPYEPGMDGLAIQLEAVTG
jgi:hypothetical protein